MEQNSYLVLEKHRNSFKESHGTDGSYLCPIEYYDVLCLPNVEFVYYEPRPNHGGVYWGYGNIHLVNSCSKDSSQCVATIRDFLKFEKEVESNDSLDFHREAASNYDTTAPVRQINKSVFEGICKDGGIDLDSLGLENEKTESDDASMEPFDLSKIKVERTQMTVFQILRKIELDEIKLDPEFQRNFVWDLGRQSRLVESALLNLPLPALYFDGVDADKWTVVDGLQRLSTIRDFTNNHFSLRGLEYLGNEQGKYFNQLPRGMRRQLEETTMTLFIIRPETPPAVKFTIFYRLNTGGLVLNAQEIRHALFNGQATTLLKELAETDEFKSTTGGGVPNLRMSDRECVLRFLAFRIYDYRNYKKSDLNGFLSSVMEKLNVSSEAEIRKYKDDFKKSMSHAKEIFNNLAFRKFSINPERRGRVSKALLESWANVILDYKIQDLRDNRDKIITKLEEALASNPAYIRSLSSGTGSITAVKTRFDTAHEIVKNALQ